MLKPLISLILCSLFFSFQFVGPALSAERLRLTQLQTQLGAENYGGRATAVDVASDGRRLLVATESAGLFRSNDNGVTWNRIATYPVSRVIDVKSSPDRTWLVIATTNRDYRITSSPSGAARTGGGIWISRNNGNSWEQADLGNVACLDENDTGYDISFQAGTTRVAVGTDCGLAISDDNGETWRIEQVNGADGTVRGVAFNGGIVETCGDQGHWRYIVASGTWRSGALGNNVRCTQPHAIAVSPANSNVVYFAIERTSSSAECAPDRNGNQPLHYDLFESKLVSGNWQTRSLQAPIASCRRNRWPYVRVTSLEADSGTGRQTYDLYFGNGVSSFRLQDCRATTIRRDECTAAADAWDQLVLSHADSNEIGFSHSNGKCPIIVSHDGGVDTSSDCGETWTNIGTRSGYNALQIYQMRGQIYPRHTHYYLGTQDNSVWASRDAVNWFNRICCEGGNISFRRRVTDETEPQNITGVGIGGRGNFKTDPLFENRVDWTGPTDPQAGQPIWIMDTRYVQLGTGDDSEIFLSDDLDQGWQSLVTVGRPPRQKLVVGGTGEASVIYAPATRTDGSIGLWRVTDLFDSGPHTAEFADGRTITNDPPAISLVRHGRQFQWPSMFAASALDPDRLLAVDVQDEVLKWSEDGGKTWVEDRPLTDLITGNGQFALLRYGQTSVSTIHFDPTDASRIFIGTDANGIFITLDGGKVWRKVPNSEQVPLVTSFFVDELRDKVFVGSFGRGVWEMTLPELQPDDRYEANDKPQTATAEVECNLTYIPPTPSDAAASRLPGVDARELWRFACHRARLSNFQDVDYYSFELPQPRSIINGRPAISECAVRVIDVSPALPDARLVSSAVVRAYVSGAPFDSDEKLNVYRVQNVNPLGERLANPRRCPRTIEPVQKFIVAYGERPPDFAARSSFHEYTLYVDYEITYRTELSSVGPADPRLYAPIPCWAGTFPNCFREDHVRIVLPCLADGPGCFDKQHPSLTMVRPFEWPDHKTLFHTEFVSQKPLSLELWSIVQGEKKIIAEMQTAEKLPDGRLKYKIQVQRLPKGSYAFAIRGVPQAIDMRFTKPKSSKDLSNLRVPGFLQPAPWPLGDDK